ncbi:uncharacterized protein TRIVIDRAFT_186195 [Trichoderma virens Gv29-8]|uniref:Uncharacterized protein n=1 Tax=Hypocrea virens (strain Gv29-8 / FGSC 10586) TaxID=413071 RepID=G9MNL9_HYPVG|nr:uncharacterized protein TRIVIDRAFT_186195 [Trichoderma virens Gv29-8]EHK23475.1 hypothetical protein TRIVIDRAFT_186195 [Trichoderma virens Gv29-8]
MSVPATICASGTLIGTICAGVACTVINTAPKVLSAWESVGRWFRHIFDLGEPTQNP